MSVDLGEAYRRERRGGLARRAAVAVVALRENATQAEVIAAAGVPSSESVAARVLRRERLAAKRAARRAR